MFFEGSEKKVEVIVKDIDLHAMGLSFWNKVVKCADASIISVAKNDDCFAYLLSESSLFVWKDRLLILTCGNTKLVDALIFIVKKFGAENILFASFQRKNEYLSHLQASSFKDDISNLKKHIDGTAIRIGHLDSHHHYFFTSSTPYKANKNDTTSELLMYHISGEVAEYLRSDKQTKKNIRKYLRLESLFPNFIMDDFLFTPYGYSVNGIFNDKYFTIHITPQENSSYVSFETNLNLNDYEQDIYGHLLSTLDPYSWDVIGFNTAKNNPSFPQYLCLGSCRVKLIHGYKIDFSYYQQPQHEILVAEVM